MPSPATPHPAAATATGTASSSTVAISPIPAATSTSPATETERIDRRVASRACTHAPAVQLRVAAVSARPATVVLWPRTDVSIRGRNASAPKNENVCRLRMVTAAGRPGAARRAPAGRSRRRAGNPTTAPPAHERETDERVQAETAEQQAGSRRQPHRGAGAGRCRRRGGPEAPERGDQEAAAEGKERQQPEEHQPPRQVLGHEPRDTGADDAGDHPRGRHHREHPRAQCLGVPAPDGDVGHGRHCARPEALHGPAGDDHRHRRRRPTDHEPRGEQHEAGDERWRRTARIGLVAGHRDADQVGEHERAERPAVQRHAAELVDRLGERGGNGQRLERDHGDDEHEPNGERAPLRVEHAGRPDLVAHAATVALGTGGAWSFGTLRRPGLRWRGGRRTQHQCFAPQLSRVRRAPRHQAAAARAQQPDQGAHPPELLRQPRSTRLLSGARRAP